MDWIYLVRGALVTRSCGNGNEPADSIKCFLGWLMAAEDDSVPLLQHVNNYNKTLTTDTNKNSVVLSPRANYTD
jgi:hypothetical protein